jgi:hypothetical protein
VEVIAVSTVVNAVKAEAFAVRSTVSGRDDVKALAVRILH